MKWTVKGPWGDGQVPRQQLPTHVFHVCLCSLLKSYFILFERQR